ncbi:MAG: hypothetical protein L0287_38190 [Anaerolineae bacterium]|nr:hypothetical protein [Anaerolineae bacterium]
MNHWQFEQYKQMDEYNRQRMMAEIRTERLIRQTRVYHPGIFKRTMIGLANWMISKGKRLRRRYEIPATSCSQKASRNFTL